VKKHFLKLFLWTLGSITVLSILQHNVDLNEWIGNNPELILIMALLIGLIPISGPHLVFVFLFFQGALPFSVLLANSLVQNGHGSLPLLAESRKTFIIISIINLLFGMLAGLAGFLAGF